MPAVDAKFSRMHMPCSDGFKTTNSESRIDGVRGEAERQKGSRG